MARNTRYTYIPLNVARTRRLRVSRSKVEFLVKWTMVIGFFVAIFALLGGVAFFILPMVAIGASKRMRGAPRVLAGPRRMERQYWSDRRYMEAQAAQRRQGENLHPYGD